MVSICASNRCISRRRYDPTKEILPIDEKRWGYKLQVLQVPLSEWVRLTGSQDNVRAQSRHNFVGKGGIRLVRSGEKHFDT